MGKTEHALLEFGANQEEKEKINEAIRAAKKLMEVQSAYWTVPMGSFDIVARKTAKGSTGVVGCAKRYQKDENGERIYVGAVMVVFDVSDWVDKSGNVVVPLLEDYFSGSGNAKVHVLNKAREILETWTLEIM